MPVKTQRDSLSPPAKTGQFGAELASQTHDASIFIGSNIPRGTRVLRMKDVIDRTGLSRSTLYALMKSDPAFPKKVALSARTTGLIEHQLDAWIASRAQMHAAT